MIECFKQGLISPRALPEVIRQFEQPTYDWGDQGTLFHLYQALTTPLQPLLKTNPPRLAATTMKIMGLLMSKAGFDSPPESYPGFDEAEAQGYQSLNADFQIHQESET